MAPLYAISYYFDWTGSQSSSGVRVLELLSVMCVGIVVFFFAARLLKIEEISMGGELVLSFMGRNKDME
jgi:hypothetical protein